MKTAFTVWIDLSSLLAWAQPSYLSGTLLCNNRSGERTQVRQQNLLVRAKSHSTLRPLLEGPLSLWTLSLRANINNPRMSQLSLDISLGKMCDHLPLSSSYLKQMNDSSIHHSWRTVSEFCSSIPQQTTNSNPLCINGCKRQRGMPTNRSDSTP